MASSQTIYKKRPQRGTRRGAYFKCETCGDEFYVYPSYIKKAEVRGAAIRFCSMKCYDKTGENNPFWGKKHKKESIKKMTDHPNRPRFATGEDNPNFVRFGEEYGFKGSRKDWWREKLFREIGKCEKCGFDDERVLTLHHIDRNPKHNTRENLLLLCWNCHALEHWENQDGMYHFMRRRNDKRNTETD
jgi:5-methylcytosine-specific restriction endonuclease McrA